MKKYFILFISLFLLSCTSQKQQTFIDSCPEVLFSKDHRIYITSEESSLTINNLSYRAEINNYNFVKKCLVLNNKITTALSILFVVKPEKPKKSDIILPYYVAFLDDQKNIVNIQYYKAVGIFKKDFSGSSYIETEIISNQVINTHHLNKILIGFMLDQEKLNILN